MLKLIIGNRNYSSWSLRAWLYLRESGVEFEEERIPLFTGMWRDKIAMYSPAGRVPVLIDGEITVWDSLAIMEHVRETRDSALGWPDDPVARAEARSIAAEMHSGFMAIRDELPQNLRVRRPRRIRELSPGCQEQVARISDMWIKARRSWGERGPWLYGEMSIADIMYAPVALRFATYEISLPPSAQEYVDTVRGLASVEEWCAAAAEEPERLDFVDDLVPAAEANLTLG